MGGVAVSRTHHDLVVGDVEDAVDHLEELRRGGDARELLRRGRGRGGAPRLLLARAPVVAVERKVRARVAGDLRQQLRVGEVGEVLVGRRALGEPLALVVVQQPQYTTTEDDDDGVVVCCGGGAVLLWAALLLLLLTLLAPAAR